MPLQLRSYLGSELRARVPFPLIVLDSGAPTQSDERTRVQLKRMRRALDVIREFRRDEINGDSPNRLSPSVSLQYLSYHRSSMPKRMLRPGIPTWF
jgi:hypothetical protein